MVTPLLIIAALGWLAAFCAWCLCRAASRADRWAEEEQRRKEQQ